MHLLYKLFYKLVAWALENRPYPRHDLESTTDAKLFMSIVQVASVGQLIDKRFARQGLYDWTQFISHRPLSRASRVPVYLPYCTYSFLGHRNAQQRLHLKAVPCIEQQSAKGVVLNPQQQLAAKHVRGPMLVLAGAGTGKTRVVIHRIAHLLDIGVPSSEILAVTFSNKAAHEMRERIKTMADVSVYISTFHSLGVRILRESIDAIGYSKNFTIYDGSDSRTLLKLVVESLGLDYSMKQLSQLLGSISTQKHDCIPPDDVPGEYEDDRLFKDVYAAYQERLRDFNAIDFDDMIYLTVQLFKRSPQALARYQSRWSFVLVDEYQDSNVAQRLMIQYLTNRTRNIFVVGDPDQSIYAWRGARINNIMQFSQYFKDARVMPLEQNYRSTSHILKGANAVIAHNKNRYEKNLWSDLGAGDLINVYIGNTEKEEAMFVAQEIRRQRIPFEECAIFYRTHSQSRAFEDALLALKIPYQMFSGISFYERREIKDMLSLLHMVVSPSDYLAFARTVNLPRRGIGAQTIFRVSKAARSRSLPILSLVENLSSQQVADIKLNQKQKKGLNDYLHILSTLKQMVMDGEPLEQIVKQCISISNYTQVLENDPTTYKDRKNNLEALVSKAAEWRRETRKPTLTRFLDEIYLSPISESKKTEDSVSLMTLHAGKGLEFSMVFVVGVGEQLLPHEMSSKCLEGIEEERRLFFVGMTRAKRALYLTAFREGFLRGQPIEMDLSRFLEEIPRQYRQHIDEELDAKFAQLTMS